MAEEQLTHWKRLVNKDYLGAYSLQGITDKIILTIKSVKHEMVKGPKGVEDDCVVVSFEEKQVDGVEIKPMIMNATNCNVIEKIYGTPYIQHWVGKKIEIVVAQTTYQRDLVDCLRVVAQKPEVPTYFCEICGKEIEAKIYKFSKEHYGKAYCSKECKEEDLARTKAKEEPQTQEQVQEEPQEQVQEQTQEEI